MLPGFTARSFLRRKKFGQAPNRTRSLRLQTAPDGYGNSRAGTLKYIIACDYSSAHIRFPTEENEIPAKGAERMSYGSR